MQKTIVFEKDFTEELEFDVVMIGGPPRSGTSILHATICSSDDVNNFIAEYSYFTELFKVYYHLLQSYDVRQESFFDSKENMKQYHASLLRKVLYDTWVFMGKPKKLIHKEPFMTPHFPAIAELLPEVKFVVSMRNPLDIFSSFKTIWCKENPDGQFGLAQAKHYCDMIMNLYLPLFERINTIEAERIFLSKYEDFVEGKTDAAMNRFLGIEFNEEKTWDDSYFKRDRQSWQNDSAWHTDLYWTKGRKPSSVGNYKTVLSEQELCYVSGEMGGLIGVMKYENPLHQLVKAG